MALSREALLAALPITHGDLTIRPWMRQDVDLRAEWPAYPPPYSVFTSSLGDLTPPERDAYFAARDSNPARITLTVDHREQPAIGYLVLSNMDWAAGRVGNMGVRVHPDWCDRGIGTAAMRCVAEWCARCGMRSLCLDVAEPNRRAVRCYEKVGFCKESTFTAPDGVPFWVMALPLEAPEHQ